MTVSIRRGIRRLRTSQDKAKTIEQLFNVQACQRIVNSINAIYDDAPEVMANAAQIRTQLTEAVDAFKEEVSVLLEVLNQSQGELLANCNHDDAFMAIESLCANMLAISRHTVAHIIANLVLAISQPYTPPSQLSVAFGNIALSTVRYMETLGHMLDKRLYLIDFRIGRFFRKIEPLFTKIELRLPKLRREDITEVMMGAELPDEDDLASEIAELETDLLSEEEYMLSAINALPTGSAKLLNARFKQDFQVFMDQRGEPLTPRHHLDELLANIDESEQSMNSVCENYCPTLYDFCYCSA